MKRKWISIMLFLLIIVYLGCGNKQKQTEYTEETLLQQTDTLYKMIDKSNLEKEDILSWDYDQALTKLGTPVSQHTFSMTELTVFTVELQIFFPKDPDIKIRELTFKTDSVMNLTIWYTEKDNKWTPVHFRRWNINNQY